MYKKVDPDQLYLDDFKTQFYGKLRKDNRWVKMAALIPWDDIEEMYSKNFVEGLGAEAINARIAFGALLIKENENLTDESTVAYIMENPYMQYFLGLHEFTDKPLFDASMMTHFRKRFSSEMINQINRTMFEPEVEKQMTPDKGSSDDDDQPPSEPPTSGTDTADTPKPTPANRGTLMLDATAAPADIRYPSDLSLLNEAREDLEQMIDELWEKGERKGHKTGYNRKKARNRYLALAKQKKPRYAKTRKEIGLQLSHIKSNLTSIDTLLSAAGPETLPPRRMNRLFTIRKVYEQQKGMYDDKRHSCDDRIVNLRQPHIRPLVRGKSGKPFEFGQKINAAVISGYTFINRQSYDNFNEGITLIDSVEAYKLRYGFYPETVLADKAYRNRKNLAYCKEHGIRLSGPRLGRPKKHPSKDETALAIQDNKRRNTIEGKFGVARRRYGLGLIMSYLPQTGLTEAAIQILCMNVSVRMRELTFFIFQFSRGFVFKLSLGILPLQWCFLSSFNSHLGSEQFFQ
jgi:hypothetical protein